MGRSRLLELALILLAFLALELAGPLIERRSSVALTPQALKECGFLRADWHGGPRLCSNLSLLHG